jgi:hypothetical protein
MITLGQMPTPFPTSSDVLLEPPSASESAETARGVASAVAPPDGLTDLQRILLETLFKAMTGNAVELRDFRPMTAPEMGRSCAGGTCSSGPAACI